MPTNLMNPPASRGQWAAASGYLLILLLPALLVVGAWLNVPVLTFATVLLVFPLARAVFGGARPQPATLWSKGVATFLHRLPVAYAGFLWVALVVFLLGLALRPPTSALNALGAGLSLWATLLFATGVAHDLIHRRDRRDAKVGSFIAALAGYPLFAFEHLSHHARAGDTELAEWPRVDESVWGFALRRVRRIASAIAAQPAEFGTGTGTGTGTSAEYRNSASVRHSAYAAAAVTLATWAAFTVVAGSTGFFVYGGAIAGVTFAMQLSTYLQHWGLGDDSVADAANKHFAWEGDCLFQSWTTLNLSFHHAHHRASREPYYRIGIAPDSPRLPAGYVVLMFVCFVPPLWRKVMLPVLAQWKSQARPL